MDKFSIARFIIENLGLVVGLFLVLAATRAERISSATSGCSFGGITAGLAVLAFRTYQVISANKRLREADHERKQLRGELDDLGKQRKQMAKELQDLNNELNEIKTKLALLIL